MTQEEWNAIKNKNPSYDSAFLYASKRGKTVCRPSCTVKKCRPQDIIIFKSFSEASEAGYHPCGRCRPDLADWHGAKNDLAQKAKAYIDEHLVEKFSLDELADALFINKFYLSRIFKECENRTLLDYYNFSRCSKAAELLKRPEYNITYISDTIGYANSSHFARIFKDCFGMSPSEYRKKYFSSFK